MYLGVKSLCRNELNLGRSSLWQNIFSRLKLSFLISTRNAWYVLIYPSDVLQREIRVRTTLSMC